MKRVRTLARLLLALPLLGAGSAALAQGEDWVVCAQEGQTCRVSGNNEVMVRFGADGRYAFRVTREPQFCTIEAFGHDPRPNVRKHCEISTNWRRQARYRDWQTPGGSRGDWEVCASEGDTCQVPGPTLVRYGADGRYTERQATGQAIPCNNAVFGDPIEGVAKQCSFRRGGGSGGGHGGGPGGGAGMGGLPWETCARENEVCRFRGPAMLRYGAQGRYLYREAENGLQCSNESFGGDPNRGANKRCEILRMR